MSNIVTIEPTEFIDVRSGNKSYGYRIYDAYGCHYDNSLESIPDDDLELLGLVSQSEDNGILDILDFMSEHKKGVMIGDIWYDYSQIEHLI